MSPTPDTSRPEQHAPHLEVVRGSPSGAEVAALVAVLTARARATRETADSRRAPRSAWRDRSRLVRRPPRPGPAAWRASFHPG